jgi:hypothetical protein
MRDCDRAVTRARAAVEHIGRGADLMEGHQLEKGTKNLVPATAIGRVLTPEEAAKLVRRLERGIPKRPAGASVNRRSAARKRA